MTFDRAARESLPTLPLAASEIPLSDPLPSPVPLTGARREIWERALPYLDVRDNDAHSLYAFALATALLHALPGAREDVVLPAVLLHDTGWKTVDPADILPAIAGRAGPAGQETIRRHETEGAALESLDRGPLDDSVDRRQRPWGVRTDHAKPLLAVEAHHAFVVRPSVGIGRACAISDAQRHVGARGASDAEIEPLVEIRHVVLDDLKVGTVAVLMDDPDVARVERARNDECHRTS